MVEFDETDVPGTATGEGLPVASATTDLEVPAGRSQLVLKWADEIKRAKKFHNKAFKRMEKCRQLATYGADEKWIQNENFIVPILNRHINMTVSQLYAKNPTPSVRRKKRLMFELWDGKAETLIGALQGAMMGDINAAMIVQEAQAVVQYNRMLDRMAKTLEILWNYYTSEQAYDFENQLKATVRRTKVDGVGWVKLAFQRLLEPRPEVAARINDVTSQIASLQRGMKKAQEGEIEEDSPEMEQLRYELQTLEAEPQVVVREGPVFDFPRGDEVIVDPRCRHLKTLAGAQWVAHEFDMTPDEIEEIYKVDVRQHYKAYTDRPDGGGDHVYSSGDPDVKECAKVWEIQDRKRGQTFTICEGYPDFLKEPAAPDVKLERFFTLFPLVFNECENDKEIYPPSDVWQARHIQQEYNRSREALRQHRKAAKPYWVTTAGALEEEDERRLADHADHEIVKVNALASGQRIEDVLQRGPTAPIDPNLYEVEQLYSDLMRTVGAQEANLGGTSNSTATESSIAENSRLATVADNVADLDKFLTDLARSTGHLLLQELDRDTVVEIAGPGAVWPTTPLSRAEIEKDLFLEIKAGSSGRPNQAAKLANMERGMPFITMLPNINPTPLAREYLELLDIDLEDAIAEGMPSVVALNQMAGRNSQAGGDPRSDPNQQGQQGGQNVPDTQVNEPMGQPAFPAMAPQLA